MTAGPVTFPAVVQPQTVDQLMDAVAWMLATAPSTSEAQWILGDVGMGAPTQLPYGYISLLNQTVKWMTSNGGSGGLASGQNGLDDWSLPVVITVVLAEHNYVPPVVATPPAGSAFAAEEAQPLPYYEQPGWRLMEGLVTSVLGVFRQNVTVGGFAATTSVVESKPILLNIDSKLYRCQRITVQAQQRRVRGN